MPSVQLEALIAPISGDNPCGADLEYDPAFAELERAAQGKPEQQIGNTVVPAADPDWKVVERQATELLGRAKDLRIGVHLANGLLRTRGLQGFTDGVRVIAKLVETFWDGLHPKLDPDDGNDPTMRVNILASLASPTVITALRATPLVMSRTLGTFALKDIEAALENSNGEQTTATVAAAAMDCDLAALEATVATTRGCIQELSALEKAVAAHIDSTQAPSFAKLSSLLRKADTVLGGKLAERAPVVTAGASNGDVAAAGVSVVTAGFSGQIASREDVIKALDRISAYYTRHEPSSPIPLFMERCKRMVMMSFVDIVKELVPDALSQVEVLKGRSE